jgi:transposase-like protein
MGQALSGDRPSLAPGLGPRRPVFRVCSSRRKMIYTANAVEALHHSLRKIIKTRGSFPNAAAVSIPAQSGACRYQMRVYLPTSPTL